MLKSIGTVIVLYAVTQMFGQATAAFEEAAVATLTFVTAAAETSIIMLETN